MAFDQLLNKPDSEIELLNQIVGHIQSHYMAYQNACFFMKLEKIDEQTSQIIWIKSFADIYELGDFYYDTVYNRACILLKFEYRHYELFVEGFQVCDRFKILTDKIEGSRPLIRSYDVESIKMLPRELIERGFGEILEELNSSKKYKAV